MAGLTETASITAHISKDISPNIPFTLRLAKPEDNERLIDLARRCPMKGQLEMYMDRHPDFFATNRVQGEEASIYVAESEDGRIVGCAAFTERLERRGDKPIKVLHFGDLRSDPALRRGKIAASMVGVYKQLLANGGYDHGVVEILEGNGAARSLNKIMTDHFIVSEEGHMDFYQLVPFRSYRISKKWHYRPAEKSDLPQLVQLFATNYGNAPGAPHFTLDWLEKELTLDPSFQLDHIWVAADENNKAVAMMGLWDQSSFRRTVATKFTRGIKGVVRILAAVGLLWKLPPLPREGQALRFAYGRWPLAEKDQVEALASLIRFVLNHVHRDRKHQFLSIGFHENDPLSQALEGITKVQEKIEIFTHWAKDSEEYKDVKSKPEGIRFVDLSLI